MRSRSEEGFGTYGALSSGGLFAFHASHDLEAPHGFLVAYAIGAFE